MLGEGLDVLVMVTTPPVAGPAPGLVYRQRRGDEQQDQSQTGVAHRLGARRELAEVGAGQDRLRRDAGQLAEVLSETIETHRRAVREATLDTTAALVAEHGLMSITMSRIADETGIGRATLYKYFPDVAAILLAWHERHVAAHLAHLTEVRDQAGDARERLEAVLEAYALLTHEYHGAKLAALHGTELMAILHRGEHVNRAQQELRELIRDLLNECVAAGAVRDDVAPAELASYCLHALTAASSLPSRAAVRRLVTVALDGLYAPIGTPLKPSLAAMCAVRSWVPPRDRFKVVCRTARNERV
jgi:AcrR family transcriptional regulator